MHGLRNGHKIHAAVRQTVALRRRHLEAHAVHGRRRGDLLCRRVLGVDGLVPLCQSPGRLAIACVVMTSRLA